MSDYCFLLSRWRGMSEVGLLWLRLTLPCFILASLSCRVR